MKSETIGRGNVVVRKEAVIGINYDNDLFGLGKSTLYIYLIGGQTISIPVDADKIEAEYKRWKTIAAL